MDELVKQDNVAIVPDYNPNALIALAVQKDIDLERMSKLMDLQERWQKNEARKAYVTAMAEFKKDPPKIIRDMHVEFTTSRGKTAYNHASLGNVVGAITEGLSKHGMTANWNIDQNERIIKVTCALTHIAGHTETVSMSGSPDESCGKNSMQQIASTTTYLKRYTLLSITGLDTNEAENDGRTIENGNGHNKYDTSRSKVRSASKGMTQREYLDKVHSASEYLASFNALAKFDEVFAGLGYSDVSAVEPDKYEFVIKKLREVSAAVTKESKRVKAEADKAMAQAPEPEIPGLAAVEQILDAEVING